jgi:hypothetical protein
MVFCISQQGEEKNGKAAASEIHCLERKKKL